MQFEKAWLDGIFIIKPQVFRDPRGAFLETYNHPKYLEIIGNYEFPQDNISHSVKNTIRGLHFQTGKYAQSKLCQVIDGRVLDVAVDLRNDSPTYGKYFSIELSSENNYQIFIPAGFAHGFSVLSEKAIFMYKCSALYNKDSERSIRYNDPSLNIDWKVADPVISQKDLEAPLLRELEL